MQLEGEYFSSHKHEYSPTTSTDECKIVVIDPALVRIAFFDQSFKVRCKIIAVKKSTITKTNALANVKARSILTKGTFSRGNTPLRNIQGFSSLGKLSWFPFMRHNADISLSKRSSGFLATFLGSFHRVRFSLLREDMPCVALVLVKANNRINASTWRNDRWIPTTRRIASVAPHYRFPKIYLCCCEQLCARMVISERVCGGVGRRADEFRNFGVLTLLPYQQVCLGYFFRRGLCDSQLLHEHLQLDPSPPEVITTKKATKSHTLNHVFDETQVARFLGLAMSIL
jgi:hypothetical protein